MCGNKGCKDKKCNGCGAGNADALMAIAFAEMQDNVETLMAALKPFTCGHPIILAEQADDVACFDLDSGLGSDCWEGWAICNGETHKNAAKVNVVTPNFTDRFVVMAGGTYAVDDIGGEAEHTLTIPEMPTHTHVVTDPGHEHVLNDPGHTHAITDPGHNHPFTDPGHTHTVDDHYHRLGEGGTSVFGINYNSGTGPFAPAVGYTGSDTNYGGLISDNAHLDIDSSVTGISMDDAFTGLSNVEAFAGINMDEAMTGITVEEEGGSEAHNNLPPYIAALFVMKL